MALFGEALTSFFCWGHREDLIFNGGSNIYPREVEEVLLYALGAAEVGLVGAPDP